MTQETEERIGGLSEQEQSSKIVGTRIDPEIVAQMPDLKGVKPESCLEKLKRELITSINS